MWDGLAWATILGPAVAVAVTPIVAAASIKRDRKKAAEEDDEPQSASERATRQTIYSGLIAYNQHLENTIRQRDAALDLRDEEIAKLQRENLRLRRAAVRRSRSISKPPGK